jgi:large subunit ribosomal protein L5
MVRLYDIYLKKVVPAMMEKFSYKNRLQTPRLEKIVINMGIGEASKDIKILEMAMNELALITGQKPAIRRAKKAIANFKIKKGQPVGCKVTLRGRRMYEFFDRLINVALPRIKDFRGVPENSFDNKGNYALGISEQTIFPEIDYDKVKKIQGMSIVIITTAKSQEESYELLKLFGMPFKVNSK